MNSHIRTGMKIIGLGLTLAPGFLVFAGLIPLQTHYMLMFAGCILWFGSFVFKDRHTEPSE